MYHHGREQQQEPHKPSQHERQHNQSSSSREAPLSQTQDQGHVQDRSAPAGPSTLSERRAARNPELQRKLEHMAIPLAPLVQMTTGLVHPAFPMKLLNFWLLTDDQLESMAHFYHQRTPSYWTGQYPCPVRWGSHLPLEEKRRKIGKFIGLRGCESPILLRTAEELMEEAMRQAVLAEEYNEALRRKHYFSR